MKLLLSRIGAALGSVIVTLAILEVVCRIAGLRADENMARVDRVILPAGVKPQPAPFGFLRWATLRTTYPSNPRGYFAADNHIDHVHNSKGWRDVEHSVQKPPNTYRILGLGDSYLWGQGVRREDIVLTRLGRLLAGEAGARRIETINTATSGTNTRFQQELLGSVGLTYNPDLVILHFVLNDVEPDLERRGKKIDFHRNYTSIYLKPDRLGHYSYLWGWARQRFLINYRARRYIKEAVSSFVDDTEQWADCRAALDEIQLICRTHNVPLLVVIFPFFHDLDGDYPFQPIHDLVRKHCRQHGIPVLDLREAYKSFHGPELWVHPIDQHPNERGHAVAAKAIADFLLRHRKLFHLGPRPAAQATIRTSKLTHSVKATIRTHKLTHTVRGHLPH